MCTLYTHSYIKGNRCNHNSARNTADPVHKHRNYYMHFLSGVRCALFRAHISQTDNKHTITFHWSVSAEFIT